MSEVNTLLQRRAACPQRRDIVLDSDGVPVRPILASQGSVQSAPMSACERQR
jgi:hypothetical protein